MNAKTETKVLTKILDWCNEESNVPRKMEQTKTNLSIGSGALLVIVFVLSANGQLNQTAGGLLIFASGFFGGGALFQAIVNIQWPILKRHLNTESMKARMNELEI